MDNTSFMEHKMRFQVNRVDSGNTEGIVADDSVTVRNNISTSRAKRTGSLQQITINESISENDGDSPIRSASPAMLIPPMFNNASNEYTTVYDTKYGKSFRHFTREALPRLDNYRNVMSIQAAYRPTLDELHDMTIHSKPEDNADVELPTGGFVKFGWIKGVLVRCLLNIWGVMLFLRLSWVVGQAGIGESLLLILFTGVVTIVTSLSMAAICTNGHVKAGGTYYMISRSLGPEFGASIGLIFSVANAVAVAMYTVGFAESMNDLLEDNGLMIVDGGQNDIRIIGTIAIVAVCGIVVIGMEWEAKAQVVLLVILLVAMVDFVIGSFIGPLDDDEVSKGFVGYGGEIFATNFVPEYRYSEGMEQNFFSVFSIFFPAATGILAGANISGDLADPQVAIPKGTMLAIIITTISYLGFGVIAGSCVVRDASGNATEAVNGSLEYMNCTDRICNYGLQNSFQVMELVAIFGPLIYAGCFAATLSSALASFVSAPKVFQALCNDKLYPYLEFFGKGYGKNNEPVRGYILTFIIALGFILIAELNAIAPLISNFFLAAYALVNFSTFHASLIKPIGWRPTFRYYNMWLSLVGCILCIAVMFLISWWTALITIACVCALYLIVMYKKPDVNWGSTTQASIYKNALATMQQLNNVEDHVKNYRPQILVLTGLPSHRPPLVDFAYLITKNLALMMCGHIVKSTVPQRVRVGMNAKTQCWLRTHKIKAFYNLMDDCNFEEGAKALLQASGVGKMKPNIILMGFKNDWRTCPREDLRHYFNAMHKAFDMCLAVSILRVPHGFDYSKVIADETIDGGNGVQFSTTDFSITKVRSNSEESLPRNQSFSQVSQASSGPELSPPGTPHTSRSNTVATTPAGGDVTPRSIRFESGKSKKKKNKDTEEYYKAIGGGDLSKDVLNDITFFQCKHKNAVIDVWWLYDDGGLTLLLPYVMSTRSNWAHCKLRIFALANKKEELDLEQRSMASLLSKFRIDYADIKIIPEITKRAQESTRNFFNNLIEDFENVHNVDEDDSDIIITDAELLAQKDKTNRHLRLRELMIEHSKNATMIVMTLPMPRRGAVSAPLFMAWLDVLTRDMPPFLLVRGNHQSVLTFYS